MKIRSSLKMMALIALIAAATSLSAASVCGNPAKSTGLASRAQASDGGSYRATRMFNIGAAQTARLKVSGLPDTRRDDPFFRLELSFVDRKGKVVSRKVHNPDGENSAVLDLHSSELLPRGSSYKQLKALVRFVGTPDTRLADRCIVTLEVFDNKTGELKFVLPVAQKVQKVQ